MGVIGIDKDGQAQAYIQDEDKSIPNLDIVAGLDVNEENLYFIVQKMCEELGLVCDVCGATNTTVGSNENIDKKLCASCFEEHF